jgi:hypothetical protein
LLVPTRLEAVLGPRQTVRVDENGDALVLQAKQEGLEISMHRDPELGAGLFLDDSDQTAFDVRARHREDVAEPLAGLESQGLSGQKTFRCVLTKERDVIPAPGRVSITAFEFRDVLAGIVGTPAAADAPCQHCGE